MKAYVFVTVHSGKSTAVVERLRRVGGVVSADICWGLPDIVALVEAPDAKALQALVLEKIQTIDGVKETDTHLVFEK